MGGSSSEFLTEMATYLQTEMNIIASNMWVMLPGCKLDTSKKIFEYNKGVCNSNASFLN
jgi:c-di-AMP phosphodiesterase-like protein